MSRGGCTCRTAAGLPPVLGSPASLRRASYNDDPRQQDGLPWRWLLRSQSMLYPLTRTARLPYRRRVIDSLEGYVKMAHCTSECPPSRAPAEGPSHTHPAAVVRPTNVGSSPEGPGWQGSIPTSLHWAPIAAPGYSKLQHRGPRSPRSPSASRHDARTLHLARPPGNQVLGYPTHVLSTVGHGHMQSHRTIYRVSRYQCPPSPAPAGQGPHAVSIDDVASDSRVVRDDVSYWLLQRHSLRRHALRGNRLQLRSLGASRRSSSVP
ncbi:hypothetical protein FB451DRAFT_394026 [Mycena latifolia]|nr:hypothetical protein FB451DRAFT_394026 [Mycena latifolia]